MASVPRYLNRFLAMGAFAAAATILGNFGYIRSAAAYVEAVKQVEIPVTLAVGMLFFKEHERVQAIWPGWSFFSRAFSSSFLPPEDEIWRLSAAKGFDSGVKIL